MVFASLRLRILTVVAFALVLATFVGGLQARNSAGSLSQDLQDQNLRAMAFGFFSSVTASQGSWVTPEELAEFVPADVDQYFYRLIGPQGAYISGYNFVQVPVPASAEPGVAYFATWTDGSGETFRGVSIRAFVDSFESPGWVTLQVAQSTRGAQALVADQMLSYYWTAALISVGALVSAVIILSTIFRPLSRLATSVARRSAEDLSAIQQQVPVEVQPLKDRLNTLFLQMREEQGAKNRLLSNVAHQLRTPLTTIRLRSRLAKDADDPLPHLNALDREALRAGDLAAQLVTLEGSSKTVRLEALDLVPLVQGVAEDWQPAYTAQGVDIDYLSLQDAASVLVDKALFVEMLSNLLDNALKHAQASKVTIGISGSSLMVQDDGVGVPEDQIPHIFERFYRGSDASQRDQAGHGLGLSIVKEFATRVGARIDVEAQTGFLVRLTFQPSP